MKKLILLAIAAILSFTGCITVNETIIGDGTVSCSPSTLTVKVGETKSFTFNSPYDKLTWRSMGPVDGAKEGEVDFWLNEGTPSISVEGVKEGDVIIYCTQTEEVSQTSSTIRGGVKVTVTK